jgi:hypothetical protein
MVRPGRDRLTDAVEVDETSVGGVEPGGGKRHFEKKALVVAAAEVRGRAIGRIRHALATKFSWHDYTGITQAR